MEIKIDAVAGHSVGEYAAMVAAGVVDLAEAAQAVQVRGEAMAAAGLETPGTMAAILGLDRATLETALDKIDGIVVVANDNSPGQVVISGEVAAVEGSLFRSHFGRRQASGSAKRKWCISQSAYGGSS